MLCNYFLLGHKSNEEEVIKGIYNPDSSEGNKFLSDTLSSLGVEEDECQYDKLIINPESNDIDFDRVSDHIINSDPRVIICLGSKPAELLLGDKFISLSTQAGKVLKAQIGDKEYPMVMTYSPEYPFNQRDKGMDSSGISSKFISDIMYATKIVRGELSDISAKELVLAKSYNEFVDYCETHLKGKPEIGFDIETNAQPVHSEAFRIVGFSLSADKMSGIYVVRESLEFNIGDDWNKIVEYTSNLLKSCTSIIHNSMYEIPSIENEWGFRIENFEDTLVMARLLLGGKTGAGLKEQCAINLGYPDWDADLTDYREAMDELRSIMKPTASGTKRREYLMLVESTREDYAHRNLIDMKNLLESECNEEILESERGLSLGVKSKKEHLETIKDINSSKSMRICNAVGKIVSLIKSYYDSEEFMDIMTLVSEELIRLVEAEYWGFLPYSSVPLKLLAVYGAIDAVGAFELKGVLSERITKESTELVDLWKGYRIMKKQFIVATSMEMNGLFWNDEVASNEQDWFNNEAMKAMKNLIRSGFLDNYIFNNCRTDWVKKLIAEDKPKLVELIGEDFHLTQKGIKKNSGGREILFRNIEKLIDQSYWDSVRDELINYAKYELIESPEFSYFDDFKYIYNPASPKQEEFLTSVLVTTDIKVAAVLNQFNLMMDDPESGIDRLPYPDKGFFDLLNGIKKYNVDAELYNDSEEGKANPRELISQKELFTKFMDMLGSTVCKSYQIKSVVFENLKYVLSSGAEPDLIHLYHLFELTGVDVEELSTWSKEFEFLFNYRMYKKCIKMVNTYITGNKVGRGSVWEISRKDIDNYEVLPKRICSYSGHKPDDREYLMQPKYGVCTADTLRWQTGMHTIPSTSSIKNIYTSRYPGGVIFAPDYSQMEVRAIAGASNCQSMIDAFVNGTDIHRFNACFTGDTKVWLADGRKLTFEELAEEFQDPEERFWVYSLKDDDTLTLGRAYNPRITMESDDILEVTLDNGISIKCTSNHLWRTRNGYVPAKDLYPGISISPLYIKYDRGYQMYYDLHNENFNYTHKLAADLAEPGVSFSGMVRHHRNFNKLDNRPENLMKMNWRDHQLYHCEHTDQLWSKEANEERSATMKRKYAEGISEQGNSEARKKACAEVGRRFLSKDGPLHNDEKYVDSRRRIKEQGLKNLEKVRYTKGSAVSAGIRASKADIERRREHMRRLRSDPKSVTNNVLRRYESRISKGVEHINPSKVVEYIKRCSELSKISVEEVLSKFPELRREDILRELYYNHKVVSVKRIPGIYKVYDLSVETYSNFAIDTSDENNESGVFVHNSKIFKVPEDEVSGAQRRYSKMFTFSLLYGASYQSVASSFLGGDLAAAHKMFDDFYEAFPEIRNFINERHKEMLTTGRVSVTKTGMFLRISPDDFPDGEAGAKRAAQNYPIQSSASNMAGYILGDLDEYLRKNNMKTRPILFIHDSLEFDVHPDEMLFLSQYFIRRMNEIPLDEFNIPAKVDLELGVSLGQGLEASKMQISEDNNSGEMVIEGSQENFDLLVNHWRNTYKVVEWEELSDPTPRYIPRGDLFIPKLALSKGFGTTEYDVKRKVKIIVR